MGRQPKSRRRKCLRRQCRRRGGQKRRGSGRLLSRARRTGRGSWRTSSIRN